MCAWPARWIDRRGDAVARLDPFLQYLWTHGGDELVLRTGRQILLIREGTARALSRETLDAAMIRSLIGELAPPGLREARGESDAVTFTYRSPAGPAEIEVRNGEGGPSARIRSVGAATAGDSSGSGEGRREIERLLRLLVERGASDLHLRCGEPPILRRDGELVRHAGAGLTAAQLEPMLAGIMPPRVRAEWRETLDADWAWEIEGVARFRCNAGRDRHGPMAVIRVIPTEIRTADDLGLSREVQELCQLSKGLVLVTGPTGSGKSTTLAALIDLINRTRTDHILTIEDPIEFVHRGARSLVTQREVGVHTRSFASALRAALREDPDVVLVGELRDLETISIALETAETGHLVFGTLHTTTAPGTIDRIIDQFPPAQQAQVRVMLSETLRGVVAQVLCRRIGGGRVAAREVLLSTPAVANLIREGKTFQIPSIMQTSRKIGMITLNDTLLELVESGQIEPVEAWLKAAEKASLVAALRARGLPADFAASG
jgi:twitching motility protein PilT